MSSTKLIKAILAMDSYNRGYDAGILFGSNVDDSEAINGITKIGNYTVYDSNNSSAAQADGFYAIAYQLGTEGPITISYRGTDSLNPLAASASDALHGYGTGGGISVGGLLSDQSKDAVTFYQDVYATNENISLVGHC